MLTSGLHRSSLWILALSGSFGQGRTAGIRYVEPPVRIVSQVTVSPEPPFTTGDSVSVVCTLSTASQLRDVSLFVSDVCRDPDANRDGPVYSMSITNGPERCRPWFSGFLGWLCGQFEMTPNAPVILTISFKAPRAGPVSIEGYWDYEVDESTRTYGRFPILNGTVTPDREE